MSAKAEALFRKADVIFAEADKLFAEMDQIFAEARQIHARVYVNDPDQHTVRFKSLNWGERIRYSFKFAGMAVTMLFRGAAQVRFKRRPTK